MSGKDQILPCITLTGMKQDMRSEVQPQPRFIGLVRVGGLILTVLFLVGRGT